MSGFFFVLLSGAAPATPLDTAQVAQLAQAQAPEVQAAVSRVEEARALQVGAGTWAPSNPELGLQVGPARSSLRAATLVEFMVTLKWPLDIISGAPHLRSQLADARLQEAEAELLAVRRSALATALDLYMQAASASAHAQLAAARLALDTDLLRSAQVRRDAGATGDADVALATVLQAASRASLHTRQAAAQSLQLALYQHLGLDPPPEAAPLTLPAAPPPPALQPLLQQLPQRPDLLLARSTEAAARLHSGLQERLAWPVPRLTLEAARNPEYTAEIGLELPLPVYQRNQTNAAVAVAQLQSRSLATRLSERRASTELRAAHGTYTAAVAAYTTLQAAAPAMDDAEHLAQRGFALGQIGLASWVAARRETVQARAALIDAHTAAVRAQVALALAAGQVP